MTTRRYKKGYQSLHLPELGRVLRPLIICEDGKPLLSQEMIGKIDSNELNWRDFVQMGVIELIDANEEENCLVAMSPEEATTKAHAP